MVRPQRTLADRERLVVDLERLVQLALRAQHRSYVVEHCGDFLILGVACMISRERLVPPLQTGIQLTGGLVSTCKYAKRRTTLKRVRIDRPRHCLAGT